MSDKLRAILSEVKVRLQELYGDRLVDLILYGSQARGDAVEGSDIDVLVVLKGEVLPCDELDRVSDIIYDLSYRNDVVVSCVHVSEEKYARGEGPLIRNVRREGIGI
ncbi:MAG: nucleotidyltransferase domain-containing protein [Armatimonadota bacterium]